MAITRWLARLLKVEVNVPESGDDNWIEIGGLNSITHAPASVKTDTTVNKSAGREEHLIAQRGDVFTLAGFDYRDTLNGDRDPGQEAVEAIAREVGNDSVGSQFRITAPNADARTFYASAEVTLAGGGHNDAAKWSAKITVTGAISPA